MRASFWAGAFWAVVAAYGAAAQESVPAAQPSSVSDGDPVSPPMLRGYPGDFSLYAPPDAWAPVEGTCEVTFDVNDMGRVIGSTIVVECTSPDLVDAAIDAAVGWRYPPPVVDGAPQPQRGVTAEVRFRTPG